MTTAAQQAKETRRQVVAALTFAEKYLIEAAEWMAIDADVEEEASKLASEYAIRIRGLVRKYDPTADAPTIEPGHVRVIPMTELDDAV